MIAKQPGNIGDDNPSLSIIRLFAKKLFGKRSNRLMRPTQLINGDDRILVKNSSDYPYRCICLLNIIFENGEEGTGTGWLAGKRTVITAGHCLYDRKSGLRAIEIEVIPGTQGKNRMPFGAILSRSFSWPDEWSNYQEENNSDDPNDYGVIFLPEDCCSGKNLGYFGFANMEPEILQNTRVCLAGYPGDKSDATLWQDERKILEVCENLLRYQIDTSDGQSGAPVWFTNDDGEPCVVGIHIGADQYSNRAVLINAKVYNQIGVWRNQYEDI